MKKILLISSFFESPFHKNRAPYNEQLFIELKSKFEIKIIRPIAWTDKFNNLSSLLKSNSFSGKWNDIPVDYPTYYYLPRLALSTNGLMYYLSILNTFDKGKFIPDIFYSTWAYPDAYATMLLAQKYKKKYIVRVHGSDINDLAFRGSIQEKVKSVLENAAAIISPSAAIKTKMLELNVQEEKIHVIYSGIDKNKFYFRERKLCEEELSLNFGKKRVLFIGNFKINKGVLDLLQAVNILKDELSNFEIFFIGKGEAHKTMLRFIERNNLEQLVKIVGPISHDKLNPWINSSDCICLPSYAEGLPNVLLEALACKTNIIATKVGGIPEILKDASDNLIEPGDIFQLKKNLLRVLTHNSKPTESTITLRSYKEISEDITDIINSVLEQ